MKDRTLAVRLDAELDEKLKAAAERERRPLGQYVRNVLSDAMARKQTETGVAA
jgi:predicted DNA-binding protein